MASDIWTDAKRRVGQAYEALLVVGREEPAALGPYGNCRVVPLPDGLECRVTIARAPEPGEIRIAGKPGRTLTAT